MGLQGMINHMIEILDFPTLTFHDLQPENSDATIPRHSRFHIRAYSRPRADGNGKLQE